MNVFTLSHGSAVEHSSELSVDNRYMSVHLLIRNTTSISTRSSYLEQVFLVLASCYFVAAGILEVDALTVCPCNGILDPYKYPLVSVETKSYNVRRSIQF